MVKKILTFLKKEKYLKIIFLPDYFFIFIFFVSSFLVVPSLFFLGNMPLTVIYFEIIFISIIFLLVLKIKLLSILLNFLIKKSSKKINGNRILIISIYFVLLLLNFILTSKLIEEVIEITIGSLVYR